MPTLVSLAFALLIAAAAPAAAQTATPGAGIPLELADARADAISGLRYDVRLSIPSARQAPIDGSVAIHLTLADAARPLVVDFGTDRDHVASVTANGAATAFTFVNGHIVVPAAALVTGANTIDIAFTAGDQSLNRNDDFLYALFVPARAHLALPVFDQPNLKARWTLTLEVPDAWQAVANGAELERSVTDGRATVRFAETEPLPTYLFAFVAGDFKVETAERNGRRFRMFHRETDAAKVARNRDAIFDLHARAIAYMEDYTGIPYPFGKFDFVLIPAFQFGGMEHAGEILYNASSLMLDESATQNQQLGRASVISHETAHMWFGDLVTMRWFTDVWMKEVFANFMAAKIVNPSFPEVNHDLRFLLAHYPAAYEVDRTAGANAIRQPLDNLNEAGSLYGAIIYQKAPVVMRHLEGLMGEATFRDGLRDYLKAHAFGNATWTDLIRVLDTRTDTDLAAWSHVWVEEPGRPAVRTDLTIADGRIARLAFHQGDPWGRPLLWPQRLRVTLGYADHGETLDVAIDGADTVAAAAGRPAPLYVLPNGEGWGYGEFDLDRASLAWLERSLPDITDPLTRGSAWVTLWDAVLDGQATPAAFMDLALVALPRESDEQITSRVLGYLGTTWWTFLSPADRTARATTVERVLRDGLANAATSSQKAAWFGRLRDVATTPATVRWLRAVWEQAESVPGLTLAESDYTTLALELAVREVDDWKAVLDRQFARIENPDRKARFEFVMPALSADPAERDRWFASLADVQNRRREPWVLEGLSYLHHPLRADQSAKYVGPSLAMLREIQQTGDIFFPTRWVATTLGGYQSRAVADEVLRFLDTLPPGYPERLRNITLQWADLLFRAAGVKSPPLR